MGKNLRISFVIPFTPRTGGIAVVLEYYRQLTAMGHDVKIFYPLLPYREYLRDRPLWKRFGAQMKQFLRNLKNITRSIPLFSENIPVTAVIKIDNRSIPDADAVIATAWPTAYDVFRLSPKKGRKYYLVQDYEIWHGQTDRVDATYRMPLRIIAIAPWLAAMVRDKFGNSDVTEIHNGVRLDKFYPPTEKKWGKASVLIMAHSSKLKGTRDAIDAIASIKGRYPQIELAMFGMCPRPAAPFDFEYHQDPPYEKLLSLYQNATVFIFPSHSEGWGLTPIEAMACGCALVATSVGCIPVISSGQNMVIAEAKNAASIADAVVKLLDDSALAEKTAMRGLETVRGMGWESSARKFHDCLST